jgi:hypothetical protein
MPSLRAFILSLAFAVLAFIQISAATPVPAVAAAVCTSLPSKSITETTTPSLPVQSESTYHPSPSQALQLTPHLPATDTLPAAPPANQTLLFVALGRGVQNYTCLNNTTAPVALGALATLFDGTSLASSNEAMFNTLPPLAVYMSLTSLPAPVSTFATLGHHYFGADGTPTFDLSSKGKILFGKKTGDIPAPSTANKGPAGTGAVDWLSLTAKPGYASVGLQTVYRVVTAGGNPPTVCPSAGVISVQYAAEYWFYD